MLPEEVGNLVPRRGVEGEQRRVAEFDEIRVGPILITAYDKDSAGIWIGTARDRPMIAIFYTPSQVGIGIYEKGAPGPTNICLHLDHEGAGTVQFSNDGGTSKGGDFASLSLESARKLLALLAPPPPQVPQPREGVPE